MYRDVSIPHLLLASLDIPKIFQNIYIMSGCDYTSFFAGFSKKTIIDAFSQYNDFITGGVKAPGNLIYLKMGMVFWPSFD